jgi:hypothetical protein
MGFATSVLQDLHRCMIDVPSLATRIIASPQTGHHFVIVNISVLHVQLRERCRPYEHLMRLGRLPSFSASVRSRLARSKLMHKKRSRSHLFRRVTFTRPARALCRRILGACFATSRGNTVIRHDRRQSGNLQSRRA